MESITTGRETSNQISRCLGTKRKELNIAGESDPSWIIITFIPSSTASRAVQIVLRFLNLDLY